MIRHVCDLTAQPVPEPEVTTLRISGVLANATRRDCIHLSKPAALALGRWLGLVDVHADRLELEPFEGPGELRP